MLTCCVEAYGVVRRWCAAGQKGRPIVVEIAKQRGNVDGARLYAVETRAVEQRLERSRIADRKAERFVELARAVIECDCCVPETAHQLHFAGIVPDIGGDYALWPRHAPHFGYGVLRLR